VTLHVALVAVLAIGLPVAIGRFGLIGAIGLVVICQAAGRAATLVKVVRMLNVRLHDIALLTDVAKLAVAATVAAFLTTAARTAASGLKPLVALTICGVWFSIMYAVAALGLRVMTGEERSAIRETWRRMTGGSRPPLAPAAIVVRD
jgi:hypothetical protein